MKTDEVTDPWPDADLGRMCGYQADETSPTGWRPIWWRRAIAWFRFRTWRRVR